MTPSDEHRQMFHRTWKMGYDFQIAGCMYLQGNRNQVNKLVNIFVYCTVPYNSNFDLVCVFGDIIGYSIRLPYINKVSKLQVEGIIYSDERKYQ
jgi:hypothetical protein